VTESLVETTAGKVEGSFEHGVHVFRGIPYGAPTGGRARFKRATPPAPWTGVRSATDYGPTAPQVSHHLEAGGAQEGDAGLVGQFAQLIAGLAGDEPAQSEDCLVLNVWTSALDQNQKRPVMVWVHGGAFTTGTGSWPLYDGVPLAQRGDAVVVTINHRLGALGYLHLGELGAAEYADSGNVGMLDIVLALEWVRDNIESFGGDPSRVLVFGGSGGASKTSTLLAMPDAQGLFSRAGLLSGPLIRANEVAEATGTAERLLHRLELSPSDLGKLHEIPFDRLVSEADLLGQPIESGLAAAAAGGAFMPLQPTVDGLVLPQHPFDPAASPLAADVPAIIGSTRDDMTMMMLSLHWFGVLDDDGLSAMAEAMFGDLGKPIVAGHRRLAPIASPTEIACDLVTRRTMWAGSIQWAERKSAGGAAPVYLYRMDYETPAIGGTIGACHGLDIPFAFNNYDRTPMAGDRPENEAMGVAMSEAFVRFAHDGDPNHAGLPSWPAYSENDRATMVFDVECTVVDDQDSDLRALYSEALG
jgi:para-nitrobenzyl esterase